MTLEANKPNETPKTTEPVTPTTPVPAAETKKPSNKKVDGWIEDTVGAICDPIIVMPGGWGDDLPENLRQRVTLERLCENMLAIKEKREVTATDAEVTCYLFTASLEGPPAYDWTQIYLYVAGKVMGSMSKSEMPTDILVEKLSEYQMGKLKHLKNWIYEQRVKHRKERARGERQNSSPKSSNSSSMSANNETKELKTVEAQPKFF